MLSSLYFLSLLFATIVLPISIANILLTPHDRPIKWRLLLIGGFGITTIAGFCYGTSLYALWTTASLHSPVHIICQLLGTCWIIWFTHRIVRGKLRK